MVYIIGLPSVRYTLYFVKHAVQPGRKVTTFSRQQFPRCQNTRYHTKDSDLKTNLEIRHCEIWQLKPYLPHLKACCS